MHGGLGNFEPMVLVGAGRRGDPGCSLFANTDVRSPALALTNWTGSSTRVEVHLKHDASLTFRKAHEPLSILEDSSPETVHEESSDFPPRGLWVSA